MQKLLNFLLGYVALEACGAHTARFLNLLSQNGFTFWGMERCDPTTLRIMMPCRDYKRIRRIARRSMCHVHIIKKVGLPFFTRRLRGRGALIAGLAVFCTLLWVLTSFIWVIEVEGCVTVSPNEVLSQLRECGVYTGAYANTINHVHLKNDMLIAIPKLSFISVNINGSHAKVTVRERVSPPEITEYDTPSNIIADRPGIISSITVKSGTPEVAPGDAVVEGQLLASGYMVGRAGATVQMRAIADVRARTWHTLTSVMPEKTAQKSYTGASTQRRTLIFGSFRINLSSGTGNPYTECDKIVKRTWLTLPGNLKLPIALETYSLREYESAPCKVEPDVLAEYISARMEQYIELGADGRIVSLSTENMQKNGALAVTLTAECEENIGTEQIIPKGE